MCFLVKKYPIRSVVKSKVKNLTSLQWLEIMNFLSGFLKDLSIGKPEEFQNFYSKYINLIFLS
jgi:hypothetical protein